MIRPLIKMPMLTIPTIIVARAFNSGVTPVRTLENTKIGKVVAPGPAKKLAITTSSKDNANANNHPASNDGKIRGSDILNNTTEGYAPSTNAASSNDLSKSIKRA